MFQLRAHVYQARSLIGSDASGLSDPFGRVIAGEFSKTTQVIDETLSPTWDELLIFEEILIYGTSEEIQHDPPTIIIEIFDQDKVGKSEFIGRGMAKPHVKLVEESYSKPKFPPSLEWFDISRGTDRAGELLATFELLEISSDSDSISLPPLPVAKDIPVYKDQEVKDTGPILPVPRGIRPTLARYRIEVLFWGLRDLKRVHLLKVDKPRVDIECAGHILYSSIIQNAKRNPNFNTPVKFLDVDLPEQELYRPPLTIRAVDCRSFGRYTLVGTHTINSIHKYMYTPLTKKEREAEERRKSLHQLKALDYIENNYLPNTYVVNGGDNNIVENSPLLPKDITIAVGYGTQDPTKKMKTEINKKRKQSIDEDIDDEEASKDWWTKYFASVEEMIHENKEARKMYNADGSLQMPLSDDNNANSNSNNTQEKSPNEGRKRFGFKTAATASRFAARISPKSFRKKNKLKPALCRVSTYRFYNYVILLHPESLLATYSLKENNMR